VLVPGDLDQSELFQRITAEDETERMPPASTGRTLIDRELALIRAWITQGARWQKHWSLIAPERPEPPDVQDKAWVRNPIDPFVLRRLEREGLRPSPQADRSTLIRRAALDLTGIPPTPDEVDSFLADKSDDAYEKLVDRLLASPRYGERMAVRWLDAARYADTSGYQSDGERFMWRWRDWVIEAYNRNMPFDQFTIEQIAGDLLPGASLDQKIATGFNRNHRGNAEGGIIPEEYAVEYVVDRVDTTSTVWLGLTMACARCHDHKFDPISQKEYYQVFAYFNNVPERGKAIKFGNSPPLVKAPTRDQARHLEALDNELASAERALRAAEPDIVRAQAEWEAALDPAEPISWSIAEGLVAHFALDGDVINDRCDATTASFQGGESSFAPGRIAQAAAFDGQRFVEAGDVADFGFYDEFTLGAWVYPESDKGGTVLARMADTRRSEEGYSIVIEDGRIHVNLIKRWLDDAIRLETERRLTPGRWYHVLVSYDGSRVASGVKIYVDGQSEPIHVVLDDLNQSFQSKEPLRIGAGGSKGAFHGLIDDVRVFNRVLAPEEAGIVASAESVNAIAAIAPAERNTHQANRIREYFLENQAPESVRRVRTRWHDLLRQREAYFETIPTTMVMQEMDTPRATHLLMRGQYDKPGDRVWPGVPSSLPALPEGAPQNRLGFAQWLVDPANPVTARVAVNRLWQMVFGTGLVKTVDDFGMQGEWPTHPELLDWLATEFVRTGWNVKALLKTIMTSATYCQTSKVNPTLLQKDPENRLLARGARIRLTAEVIRDQALAASGLLVEKLGGPSVRPYQPPGLWKELTDSDYKQDHGENLYRRSLYTFWKRTVAPPTMVTFDASTRETCTVRETRTNTPLQALTLLNDVAFVEASRNLAQRVMTTGAASPEARLTLAFRLATARRPNPTELGILLADWTDHASHYRAHPAAALELVTIGESPRDESLDVPELAAYTAVASLILNLDETITKE
jgi:Protein of unknown function (DUF1553)/Protein of unknown function (DUF1549)/Concanavalin A-like lectin/glucanases superfamily/Planctomycete cytochrome C